MSEEPKDFLELSEQALEDLEILKEGDGSLRTQYNRLYYAVFYAAKAALLSKNETPKTHRGTANIVYQVLYSEEKLLKKEEAIILQKLQQKRDRADYETEISFDEEEFESLYQDSKKLIQKFKEITDSDQD